MNLPFVQNYKKEEEGSEKEKREEEEGSEKEEGEEEEGSEKEEGEEEEGSEKEEREDKETEVREEGEEEERRKEKEREEKKRWKEKEREEEEVRVKAEQGLAPAIPIIATSSEHPFVTTKDAAYAPLLPQVIGQQQKLDVIAPACEEAATYGLERREERKVDVWEDIWSLAKDWKAEEEENAKIQADTTNHSYDTILAELSAIRIWAPQPPSNILERSSMVLNPASVFHISKSQAHSIPPSSAISGAPIHELSQHSHPSAVILVSALDACMSPVHASPHNSSLPVAPVERKHSLATENISANLRTIRDSKGIVRTIKTDYAIYSRSEEDATIDQISHITHTQQPALLALSSFIFMHQFIHFKPASFYFKLHFILSLDLIPFLWLLRYFRHFSTDSFAFFFA
ncbi:hypothetical protein BYT27DRAFT_7334332 [Phlegmacium glaucopus]|nr:hypothetical protein BYT27DRAFT_7334332 [Phlegmacium glaucopus]